MKHPQRQQHTTPRHRLGILLHRWHRRIGVVAAFFLIWLAFSGILLNESAALKLDSQRISWPWLMHWYGLKQAIPDTGYACGNHWIVFGEGASLLDGKPIKPTISSLRGAVSIDGILYVASIDSIILLAPDGTRVDHLTTLPISAIKRIGRAGHRIVIENHKAYASDDGDQWQAIAAKDVTWSRATNLPAPVRAAVANHLRPSLPLLRVMSDAHSGRLFGTHGPLLIDVVALAAMLLAISGVWMVLRDARRRRRRRAHHSP